MAEEKNVIPTKPEKPDDAPATIGDVKRAINEVFQPFEGGTGQYSYAKGDLLAAAAVNALNKLAVGTNDQVLTADSAATTGVSWKAGARATLTTKGDLLTFANAILRLAVGTNGQVLTADSAEASGIKWGDAAVSVDHVQGTRAVNTTGTQAVSHSLGVTPSLIIVIATAVTVGNPGGVGGICISFGMATATTDEKVIHFAIADGSNSGRNVGNSTDAIITLVGAGTGTADAVATVSAISTTAVTLNWTTNSADGDTRSFYMLVFA